jgi:hypothetical protein
MPKLADPIRVARALITQFCESVERTPKAIILDAAITVRGDSHYGRPEAMEGRKAHGMDSVFGPSVNDVICTKVEEVADPVRTMRAVADAERVRDYADIRYSAKSRGCERRVLARVIARIEATCLGLDIRATVTSLGRITGGTRRNISMPIIIAPSGMRKI